jgi:hypothetical protein
MKTLFNKEDSSEILERLSRLDHTSTRQWGKMQIAQMMAHCSVGLETATGQLKPKRIFIGRIFGPIAKKGFVGPKQFRKNNPTSKELLIRDERDLEKEKQKLESLVKKFAGDGPTLCTKHPHAFFGKLTPHEWGIAMYKHLDHHFRQFGG